MAKWRCKCGYLLSTNIEVYTEIEEFEIVNTRDVASYIENCSSDDEIKYFDFENNVKHSLLYQCPNCLRIWFDVDDNVLTSNSTIKSLVSSSNIISFKPEPIFIEEGIDIMEELRRTADKNNCEYELKYSNGKYTLEIDGKEISDECLSGVLQILRYGKKYN